MAEPETPQDAVATAGWKKDAVALALLIALVLPLRIWLLGSTEVASRDSIGYIRYALQFEYFAWDQVLYRHDQHPGYSLAVLAVSWPVRWVTGETAAETMQLAAQLAGTLAAFLLLYPMYHLGRLLFNRRVGFGGAILYQYLPISGHHLSDGISETLFLLLVATSLLQAIHVVQGRSLVRCGLCGLSVALAYLTRPEGAFVALATVLVLFGMQMWPAWRMTWRRFFVSAAALTVLTMAVGIDLTVGSGRIQKESVRVFFRLFGIEFHQQTAERAGPRERAAPNPAIHTSRLALGGAGGRRGPLFAITFKKSDHLDQRAAQSARALAIEVGNGLHYVGIVPALLGLMWSFRRLGTMPAFWVVAVYFTIQTATLFMLAMTVGYVSDRHTMTLVMCGSPFVAAGIFDVSQWVLTLIGRGGAGGPSSNRMVTAGAAVLIAALLAVCLPKTLLPLHADRAGNHAAGLCLKGRVHDWDDVVDDHTWSHLYAGMVFKEDKPPVQPPPGVVPLTYVVITRSRDAEINADRRKMEEYAVSAGGQEVFHWPDDGSVAAARVVVYVLPRASWNWKP